MTSGRPTPAPHELGDRGEFVASAGRVAGLVLAGCAAAVLLAFVWSVYLDLSGRREFSAGLRVGLFVGLPSLAAAILFAARKLEAILRLQLVMLGVACVISFYAAELILTVASPGVQPKPVMTLVLTSSDRGSYAANVAKKYGTQVDARTPTEVIADLRRAGTDAIPIITPSNDLFIPQSDDTIRSSISIDGREVMPLAGVSGRMTLACNESGQWVDYRSDAHGFNNADDVWTIDHLDIAVLGDSFAHGYCVPPDKNFVALIRQRNRATLNLGIAGDGPLLMLATLTEYLPRLAPKVVLWCYYEGNDLTDLQLERKNALLLRYLTPGFRQPDLDRQDEIDEALVGEIPRLEARAKRNAENRARNPLRFKAISFAKLSMLRERLGLLTEDPAAVDTLVDLEGPNMDVFRQTLSEAKTRTEAWGGQLYFVYLPEWARYARYSSWGKTKRDDVLGLVGRLGIPVIDIDPVFRASSDPLALFPFRALGHYTETGHRLVAEEIVRGLRSSARIDSH